MACEPLNQYFARLKSPPRFYTGLKANKRGYLGRWAIIKNELHLTKLIGLLENNEEITLDHLFPGKQNVFAEWFNGEIVLNQGKLIALKSENIPAIYEKDLHLEFINGMLTNTYIVENALDQTSSFNDNIPSGSTSNPS